MAVPSFHVGVLPDRPASEIAAFAEAIEELGYDGIWVADSQSVFRDVFVTLAACAGTTSRIRLATGVTNAVTRHPATIAGAIATLDEISGGRAILGLGVGESAVRTVGLRPARLGQLEEATRALRALLSGDLARWDGAELRLTWAAGHDVPIWYASTGLRSLQLAGRIADGVLFQVGAHIDLVRYGLRHIDAGAAEATRARGAPKRFIRLACSVDADRDRARANARGYVAAAARTIQSGIPRDALPDGLWEELDEMNRSYDYLAQGATDARQAELISDRLLDAVAVAGTPEEVIPRLRAFVDLGIDGFVLTTTGADQLQSYEAIAEHVMPYLIDRGTGA